MKVTVHLHDRQELRRKDRFKEVELEYEVAPCIGDRTWIDGILWVVTTRCIRPNNEAETSNQVQLIVEKVKYQ